MPLLLVRVRQSRGCGGLAGAVHPDDEHHGGRERRFAHRTSLIATCELAPQLAVRLLVRGLENRDQFIAQHCAHRLGVTRLASAYAVQHGHGGGHTGIGADEHLLKRLPRVLADRRAAEERANPAEERGLGARQRLRGGCIGLRAASKQSHVCSIRSSRRCVSGGRTSAGRVSILRRCARFGRLRDAAPKVFTCAYAVRGRSESESESTCEVDSSPIETP